MLPSPHNALNAREIPITEIVETKINEKCAISLDLPPLVMYDVFFAFICLSERLGSSFFAAFFAPFPKQGSLGYIPVANCSVILIFKVLVIF